MDGKVAPRPTRRSRLQLRQLLVEAGTELLLGEGLGTGAEHLTFKRVFAHLETSTGIRVTNASVIGRIWDCQSDFQTEVLAAIARDDGSSYLNATLEAIAPSLGRVDRSSEASRWTAVRELCRVGAAANLNAFYDSDTWPRWVGVWALAMAGSDTGTNRSPVIEDALRDGYEEQTESWGELYTALITYFGFRLREPLTLRQFVIAAAALSDGCVLRDRIDVDSVRLIRRPTGPDGTEQEWTLFGIGLEALVTEMLEPDPDWELS